MPQRILNAQLRQSFRFHGFRPGSWLPPARHIRSLVTLSSTVSSDIRNRSFRLLGAASATCRGRIGQLDLQVRRFRCSVFECPRHVFAEHPPAAALPQVRRTTRLAGARRRIAFSAGGEAGGRLASRLAMPVSGDTLPRLIRTAPLPAAPTPRVIGIDDWAKGLSPDNRVTCLVVVG